MEYGKNGKYNSIYSYGLQRLGADYNGAQTTYLYDGRGSMVNETNGSGTSMSAYLYDEWGSLISGKVHTNGFYSDNYLYNAEAMDITTELYYLRARYYDPSQGRFMQQDTFLGYIETPISQNLYIYCGNSPLNYIDPSGHDFSIPDMLGIMNSSMDDIQTAIDTGELDPKEVSDLISDFSVLLPFIADTVEWEDLFNAVNNISGSDIVQNLVHGIITDVAEGKTSVENIITDLTKTARLFNSVLFFSLF